MLKLQQDIKVFDFISPSKFIAFFIVDASINWLLGDLESSRVRFWHGCVIPHLNYASSLFMRLRL
jgi:hypothetical protein